MKSPKPLYFLLLVFLLLQPIEKAVAQYCASTSTGTCYHYLGQVVMGTINQTTACAAYTSFYVNYTSGPSTNIAQGASDNITLYNTSAYSTYFRVWIDWNQDFDFIDAGENVVVSGAVTSGTNATFSITCPAGATLGNTRMRVKADYYNAFTGASCSGGTEIETQDYTINVTAAGSASTSGTVNSYAAVSAVCNSRLTVSTTSGFAVGDTVLLIQMRGATANLTNTASFGDITTLNEAGLYEFLTIASISGSYIYTSQNPQFAYNATTGNVQLVRAAVYTGSSTTLGNITCPAWDGSTGGVVVLLSPNTLTVGGTINVSAKGFRAGATDNAAWGCNNAASHDYYYATSSTYSAPKGEGIASQLITSANYEGRGKIANGGGAGNNVNAGGGGGSNYTNGGMGGYQWISCADGSASLTQGINGVNLSAYYSNTINRIFMGGGGGGGHAGANVSGGGIGGAGGGIVIIKAANINGTGTINASGAAAANITNQWAGGGGGAGGTVLLEYTTTGGSLTVNVNGGSGGNAWWPNELGPGGGGGSGLVWVSGASLPAGYTYNVSGGSNGIWSTGGTAFGASSGTAAVGGLTGLSMPVMSSVVGTACTVLPVELVQYEVRKVSDSEVEVSWQTFSESNASHYLVQRSVNGIDFLTLEHVPAKGTSNVLQHYNSSDYEPLKGLSYYRMVQVDRDGDSTFYAIKPIHIQSGSFMLYPNPAETVVYIAFEQTTRESWYTVEILDALGKTVNSMYLPATTNDGLQLNVAALPSGVYFLRVNNQTKRMVITKG